MPGQRNPRRQRRPVIVESDSSSEEGGVRLADFSPRASSGRNNPYRVLDDSNPASGVDETSDTEGGGATTTRAQSKPIEGVKEASMEGEKPVLKRPPGAPLPPRMVSALEMIRHRAVRRKPLSLQAAERIAASTQKLHAVTQQSREMKAPTQAQRELTMEEVAYIPYTDQTPVDRLLESMVAHFDISTDPNQPSPTKTKAEACQLESDESPEWQRIRKNAVPLPAYEEQPAAVAESNTNNAESANFGHFRFPSYDVDEHMERDRLNNPESYLDNLNSAATVKSSSPAFNAGQVDPPPVGISQNAPPQFGNVAPLANMNNVAVAGNPHPFYGHNNNGPSIGNIFPVPVAVAGQNVPAFNNIGPYGNMQQAAPFGLYPVPMGANGLPAMFANQAPPGSANFQQVNPIYAHNGMCGMIHGAPVNTVPAGLAPMQNTFAYMQGNAPVNNGPTVGVPTHSIYGYMQNTAPAKKVQPRTPPPRFVLPKREVARGKCSRYDTDSD